MFESTWPLAVKGFGATPAQLIVETKCCASKEKLLALIIPLRFVRKPLAGVRSGFSVVNFLAKPRPHASCGIAGSHARSQMPQGCQRFAFLFFVVLRASRQVDLNTGTGVESRAGLKWTNPKSAPRGLRMWVRRLYWTKWSRISIFQKWQEPENSTAQ